jgi:menaquinone-dependent protoporphyrinogen oxidase
MEMKPVLVLYATREGHTQVIAERVMESVKARGYPADVVDVAHMPPAFSLSNYSGAVLMASVHMGAHEAEMIRFVKRHVAELEGMPAAFLSVSLSEAGAEDVSSTPAQRAQAAADVNAMISAFLTETGWHPARIKAVAGALLYTKYNFLLRFLMKRMSRQGAGATDTSKDHQYTDWAALDSFTGELVHFFQTGLAA